LGAAVGQCRHGRWRGLMAIANLYLTPQRLAWRRVEQPVDARCGQARSEQLVAVSQDHLVRGRDDAEHVATFAGGVTETLALADGVVLDAGVLREDVAGRIHEMPSGR